MHKETVGFGGEQAKRDFHSWDGMIESRVEFDLFLRYKTQFFKKAAEKIAMNRPPTP